MKVGTCVMYNKELKIGVKIRKIIKKMEELENEKRT